MENHPAANLNRTTTFNYEGLTNLATKEVWTNKDNSGATTSTDTKTYDYDSYGNRISLKNSNVAGGTTTTTNFNYGYDVQGSTSLLVDQSNGSVKASYGYTPYGDSDSTLSKGDTNVNTPFNPYRYTAKRLDSGSKTYDMGTRRFDPTTQRFLQLDQFQGALADLQLSSDPLTQNRYNLGASNPLSGIEYDGHMLVDPGGGGGSAPSPQPTQPKTTPAQVGCSAPTESRLTGCNPTLPPPHFIGGAKSFFAGFLGSLVGLGETAYAVACPSCEAKQMATGHTISNWYARQLKAHHIPTGPKSQYGAGLGGGLTLQAFVGFFLGPESDAAAAGAATRAADAASGLAESGTLNPSTIRFSQNSISGAFRDGGSVKQLATDLENGTVDPGSIPAIRVVQRDGNIYTLDNRRLAAFQQAGVDVPYRLATPQEIANEGWKFTTTNDGTSILIRGG